MGRIKPPRRQPTEVRHPSMGARALSSLACMGRPPGFRQPGGYGPGDPRRSSHHTNRRQHSRCYRGGGQLPTLCTRSSRLKRVWRQTNAPTHRAVSALRPSVVTSTIGTVLPCAACKPLATPSPLTTGRPISRTTSDRCWAVARSSARRDQFGVAQLKEEQRPQLKVRDVKQLIYELSQTGH